MTKTFEEIMEIDEVIEYSDSLHNLDVSITARGKNSLKIFLRFFTKEIIKEAMDISARKVQVNDIEDLDDRFKYMCGILWAWKRETKDGEKIYKRKE